MATVKNISSDVLSLFRADAPPVQPGDEITVRDENFVGRAWPTSTWELVSAPEGYDDVSTDEAHLFVAPDADPVEVEGLPVDLDAMTIAELEEYASEHGVDLKGTTTKPTIIAAITAHHEES